ncbi:MAG TPA: outer membrane beta-barrel protein [Vicinamibacterales bacterium]|nr:outer membrane beta-barrel protein [Vicinamibacterales bacterium]
MKRMIGGLFLVSLIVMSSPSAASDRPFSFSIGGGIATPVGGAGESLGSGGQVTIGVGVKVQPKFTLFGEYNFSSLGQKRLDIPQPQVDDPATFSGSGWYQYGGGGVTFTPWQSGKSSVYVLGGAGVYYRSVYVTTPSTGLVTICRPDWFICFPTPVTVDTVVASRSTTDPGVSIGGGYTYRLSDLASFFVEARYHYVWGPDVNNPSGGTTSASAQYFPITFGFRF